MMTTESSFLAALPQQSSPDTLWAFVCDLYRQPGVEAACLVLQDRWGWDIPLALYGCWLGAYGQSIDTTGASKLTASASRWRGWIEPLRSLRREIKLAGPTDTEAQLREQVKALELAFERGLLEALAEVYPEPRQLAPSLPILVANLNQVFVQDKCSPLLQPSLTVLIKPLFPTICEQKLAQQLGEG